LTIDARVVVYGLDLVGFGHFKNIENARDVVSLQSILRMQISH
jgi:hypothetical protein